MTVKAVPNIITSLRMALSLALLFFRPFEFTFVLLYLLCGFSDIADGFFARRLHAQSRRGALLDSIADVVFLLTAVIKLVPTVAVPVWAWLWAGAIAVLRVFSAIVGAVRFHRAAFSHTLMNKAVGMLLFCLPPIHFLVNSEAVIVVACAAAAAASAEELLINITAAEYEPDSKSLFGRGKQRHTVKSSHERGFK